MLCEESYQEKIKRAASQSNFVWFPRQTNYKLARTSLTRATLQGFAKIQKNFTLKPTQFRPAQYFFPVPKLFNAKPSNIDFKNLGPK